MIGTGDAGQTSINGLSGVVQLTSPDGTILIGSSGQSIELSGLFTQASGAVLEQKCADILSLSGTIDGVDERLIELSGLTDGLPRTQTSINGVSGVVNLEALDGTMVITVDGQTIQLSGLFNPGSGQLLESLANASGVQLLNGLSGIIDLTSPDGTVIIGTNGQTIELTTLPDAGQTSVEGVSGVIDLQALDGTMAITVDGQVIQLSGLFNPASGEILEQRGRDILILSGLILADSGQTSVNGISGVITLDSPDESVNINVNGQSIELTTPGSGAPSGASYLLRQYDDNDHLTAARVLSATSGIRLDDQGARSTSGLVIKLDFDNEPNLNDHIKWNGSGLEWVSPAIDTQTTINGLSGAITLVSVNNGLVVREVGQTIQLETLFTYTSGQIIDQKCEDINTLSGLSVQNTADILALGSYASGIDIRLVALSGLTDGLPRTQTTVEGLSGTVDLDSPNGTVLIGTNGQTIELDVLPDAGQTSINGFSGVLNLLAGNNGLLITDPGGDPQNFTLTPLFTYTSGQIIDQKCEDINTLSGLVGASTNKATLFFTETSGTQFVMEHSLDTYDFVFTLWQGNDAGQELFTLPSNVYPSGLNHVVVELDSAASGKLVMVG